MNRLTIEAGQGEETMDPHMLDDLPKFILGLVIVAALIGLGVGWLVF